MEYYRLQKISEGSISLRKGTAKPLDGPNEIGSGVLREQPVALSRLIDPINERFGTDFNQADQFFFDQLVEPAAQDSVLQQAAKVNPEDKFTLVFNNMLETLFIERMEQIEEVFSRYMNAPSFQKVITGWMAEEVYRRLGGTSSRKTVYPKPGKWQFGVLALA